MNIETSTLLDNGILSDLRVIIKSGIFNPILNNGLIQTVSSEQAIINYLRLSRAAVPRRRSRTGWSVRRPTEGFHPLVYAEDCVYFDETLGEDPLAHYIRSGYPRGRWKHPVIRVHPGQHPPKPSSLRVLIHGHFFYPELFPDFLRRLRTNSTPFDLILTTTSLESSLQLSEVAPENCRVYMVPNRGRDVGAMLTGLGRAILESYDIIGHFHSKKSPQYDMSFGERWRDFLWEHLVGGEHPMMDHIIEAFLREPHLGLIFAEDPNLNDWDHNIEIVKNLVGRMGLSHSLPQHFDFPIGNMFWSRAGALSPLLDLDLAWDDYPEEPLAVDGTIIHAIERLTPFSAKRRGFYYSTTCLPRCSRY